MLNRSASLAMSTSVLKALPGKLDIKRYSPSILYVSGARRKNNWKANDRRTHTVVIGRTRRRANFRHQVLKTLFLLIISFCIFFNLYKFSDFRQISMF